jgi:adenylate kinase
MIRVIHASPGTGKTTCLRHRDIIGRKNKWFDTDVMLKEAAAAGDFRLANWDQVKKAKKHTAEIQAIVAELIADLPDGSVVLTNLTSIPGVKYEASYWRRPADMVEIVAARGKEPLKLSDAVEWFKKWELNPMTGAKKVLLDKDQYLSDFYT